MNINSIILVCIFSLVVITVINITNQQHQIILFLVCLILAMIYSVFCTFLKQTNKYHSDQKIQFIKKIIDDVNNNSITHDTNSYKINNSINKQNKFKLDTYTKSSDSNKIINNYIEKKDCISDGSCLLF